MVLFRGACFALRLVLWRWGSVPLFELLSDRPLEKLPLGQFLLAGLLSRLNFFLILD